jgi:hypothetical protein
MIETSFVLLAYIFIGGGELELMRRPDLTRRQRDMQAIRIEDERGARAWYFSDPDESAWSPSRDRLFRSRSVPMAAAAGRYRGARRFEAG